jgi:hypothetical protein
MIASALTRGGPVPTVVLFMGAPKAREARVIYEQRGFDCAVGALWRAVDGLRLAADTPERVRARIEGRLLSVEWPMPGALRLIGGQATLLTLTFEEEGRGSLLTLTHAGFGRGPEWDEGLALHRRWWPGVLDALARGLG